MAPVENYSGRTRHRQTWSRSARVLAWSVCLAIATFSGLSVAGSPGPFRFESVVDLTDMRQLIEQRFKPGAPRAALRATFVTEGKGTLKIHPSQPGVEKYIYDIDLCRYYIWRWNISADYDDAGHLTQAYVNGDPVFAAGRQKKDGRALGAGPGASIFKLVRPRPEADLGEKELAFRVIDGDGNLATIDDQVLFGGGPTRASIGSPGHLYVYSNVEPWRSIFDSDATRVIAPYPGDCEAEVARARAAQQSGSDRSANPQPSR
jgi:hypothetical protein